MSEEQGQMDTYAVAMAMYLCLIIVVVAAIGTIRDSAYWAMVVVILASCVIYLWTTVTPGMCGDALVHLRLRTPALLHYYSTSYYRPAYPLVKPTVRQQ